MKAQAPVERVNSKLRPNVTYVVRRGVGLRDHLQECAAQFSRDVEVGFLRLAPELRFAVEHDATGILLDLQAVLRGYYAHALTAFLKACIVHAVGVDEHPISGEEFARTAPRELIEEINDLMTARVRAMQGTPAGVGGVQ